MVDTNTISKEIRSFTDAKSLVKAIIADVQRGHLGESDKQLFIRQLLSSQPLDITAIVDYLLSEISADKWIETFSEATEKVLPKIITETIDDLKDIPHSELLRLGGNDPKILISILKNLNSYFDAIQEEKRYLLGMRAVCIQADIYRRLADPKIWRHRKIPAFCLDHQKIIRLKEDKRVEELPEVYEECIVHFQRLDMKVGLNLSDHRPQINRETDLMEESDFGKVFTVVSPLRLGISSANASDNHIRTKEQGGKTLNASVDLAVDTPGKFASPLRVSARRLEEPRLVLRSMSKGFEADFEININGDTAMQSDLFFAYRRGGDESLRMVKEGLVHAGIVRDHSPDVVKDISQFTSGGGLEIITSSKVRQGSGLGTSSILSAAILKILYRLTGHSAGTKKNEYPELYDQSVLLEQSLGLNSGWQDARGACGGKSALKDLYAPPTEGIPNPSISFVEVDADNFVDRVILFDTGIARAATRGLNVVLDAYLRRDPNRYPALCESMSIHDDMVTALREGDYNALGNMATRYWELRCILDPEATNETLQHLFQAREISELCEGGMLTGAGGGGFALMISGAGMSNKLKKRLADLQKMQPFANSRVVDYQLNSNGLRLTENEECESVKG